MSQTDVRSEDGTRLPFGPYRDQPVATVAVMDPDYLLDLLREGVGPAELRAEAARVLARRGKLVAPAPLPAQDPRSGLGPDGRPDSMAARRSLATFEDRDGPASGHDSEATRYIPVQDHSAKPASLVLRRPGSGEPSFGGLREDRQAGPRRSLAWLVGGLAGLAILLLVLRYEGGADGLGGRPDNLYAPASGSSAGRRGAGDEASASSSSFGSGEAAGATPSRPTPAFDPSQPCGARVAGAIPATSAGDFLDSYQAVEFQVVRSKDTGRVTFLNSRDPYQGHFYVAIFPDDYAAFPQPPARHFQGRCVVVQGSIETYRGTPQIVLRDPGDIRIIEADPGISGAATSKAVSDSLPTAVATATEP